MESDKSILYGLLSGIVQNEGNGSGGGGVTLPSNGYIIKRVQGKTSFSEIMKNTGVQQIYADLYEQVKTNISTLNNGINTITMSSYGINIGLLLWKYSNSYFCGITLPSHLHSINHIVSCFSYATGNYAVIYPSKI